TGAAELGLFGSDVMHPRAEPTLQARLVAKGLAVTALSGWPTVQGAADVDIDLAGALGHPHGRASVSLPRLSLQGDVYTDGRLQLAFDDAGATVEKLALTRVRGGSVGGKGTIGWNGDLALRVWPRDFPLTAIPWVKSV